MLRRCLAANVCLLFCALLAFFFARIAIAQDKPAEHIFRGGTIVTLDEKGTTAEAVAVRGGRIIAVGTAAEIEKWQCPATTIHDLGGKWLMPGLIDSHVHASGASTYEFDHPIEPMPNIAAVLQYIRQRAKVVPTSEWIVLRQVFITRLAEQRYPTRQELDEAAPSHAVMFATGPDAMLSTLALKESGITADTQVTGAGTIEKDAAGQPTGMLRSCTRLAKPKTGGKSPTHAQKLEALEKLFHDYNSAGITTIGDRNTTSDDLRAFAELREQKKLTVRISASHAVDAAQPLADVEKAISEVGKHALRRPNEWLHVVGIKCFLDGGMLTGSAYMQEPWGKSRIYGIEDERYRGIQMIPPEKLTPIVAATNKEGLQFTAHSVGDAAVMQLLESYEAVHASQDIREQRHCFTHCNFVPPDAIPRMAKLRLVADIQPIWLRLDGHTLTAQFGEERMKRFQPLESLRAAGVAVGGGSDHMQKIGKLRSVNAYDPFLGMWTAQSRQPASLDHALNPPEALSRIAALAMYTRQNAFILKRETEIGTLEVGKFADLIVLDRDPLSCNLNDFRDTLVKETYIGGELVFSRD